MSALPPVGSASISLQTRQVTFDDALLNITCSFLHLLHLTFTKLELGPFIVPDIFNLLIFQSSLHICSINILSFLNLLSILALVAILLQAITSI
jgi:hypothetical protein